MSTQMTKCYLSNWNMCMRAPHIHTFKKCSLINSASMVNSILIKKIKLFSGDG